VFHGLLSFRRLLLRRPKLLHPQTERSALRHSEGSLLPLLWLRDSIDCDGVLRRTTTTLDRTLKRFDRTGETVTLLNQKLNDLILHHRIVTFLGCFVQHGTRAMTREMTLMTRRMASLVARRMRFFARIKRACVGSPLFGCDMNTKVY